MRVNFDNSYARLPKHFYARLDPTPVAAPRLLKLNVALAETLGVDANALVGAEGVGMLAGNIVPEGAEPIATVYAGHQFGHFVPQLGDGRASLLGEVIGRDGIRRDIQLKGSGPTPFSRLGDGRAALGPVLREYLISEAMATFGIPTTRSLAAVLTGENVRRETILPGAILTRVASSHIRVGTFQYFAARGDDASVRLLADHAIARHYPDAANTQNRYRAFLDAVIARQARLVASWLLVGFIHGVMNTDNCSIAGETIDYGPCAFLDVYDPGAVFSSIDHHGRYAYGNQPRIALWNLTRFAECLMPLLNGDEKVAEQSLSGFAGQFQAAYLEGLRRKIGLQTQREGDDELAQDLLEVMAASGADFTWTFRKLCDGAEGASMDIPLSDTSTFQSWMARWRKRLSGEAAPAATMRSTNPAIVPRNHLVETALIAAVEHSDFGPFEALHEALSRPFNDDPNLTQYTKPPKETEQVLQTFCGT